eukprot:5522099-Alexandrium_andersonii.AAC.1
MSRCLGCALSPRAARGMPSRPKGPNVPGRRRGREPRGRRSVRAQPPPCSEGERLECCRAGGPCEHQDQ